VAVSYVSPAGLRLQAQPVAAPEIAEGPGLAEPHHHRVTVCQQSIAQSPPPVLVADIHKADAMSIMPRFVDAAGDFTIRAAVPTRRGRV
jgi:hypothetical protein